VPDDVARLVLGTAALGLPYGLPPPGRERPELVSEEQACGVVRGAQAAGITTFDTAPSYGESEARLGAALQGKGSVWTKLDDAALQPGGARRSLEASLVRLRRERVALLSWHNWSRTLLERDEFRRAWDALQRAGGSDALGATTYGAVDALAAVRSGLFSVVQVEWNLFNQSTLAAVAPEARERGVRLALRSVLLQGVLSAKGESLPSGLRALAPRVRRASELARDAGHTLAAFAIRAALQQPAHWVLIGAESEQELALAVAAARSRVLPPDRLRELTELDLPGDPLVDPRMWPRP